MEGHTPVDHYLRAISAVVTTGDGRRVCVLRVFWYVHHRSSIVHHRSSTIDDPGRSYPSGPLSPSYLSGSYHRRWKASMRSEGVLVRSSSFIIVHHRSSNDDPGRSYPSGPLSPSYLSGSYHRRWKASMRSEGVLVRSSSFIIVHHRSKGMIEHTPVDHYPRAISAVELSRNGRRVCFLRVFWYVHRSSTLRSSSFIIVHHRSSSFI